MPVTATPVTTQILTQDDVRGFLRDIAGQIPNTGSYNTMFDLPEFSDDEIRRALKFTVARFNVMTPISNDNQEGINIWLLLLGVCEFLLWSEMHRQVRNQVTYGDGDVQPIGLDDKAPLYREMARMCREEFEEKARNFKISRNLESCYGHLGSGYRNVSRFFHV